jgi:hypothetical protein
MPQLATESFVSQYFWLIITLSLLNFIIVSNVIPNISLTLKARKFSLTPKTTSNYSNDLGDQEKLVSHQLTWGINTDVTDPSIHSAKFNKNSQKFLLPLISNQ